MTDWESETGEAEDSMQSRLVVRITELEAEYQAGQQMLADLEAKQAELQQSLLRISGAIHVLRELVDPASDEN